MGIRRGAYDEHEYGDDEDVRQLVYRSGCPGWMQSLDVGSVNAVGSAGWTTHTHTEDMRGDVWYKVRASFSHQAENLGSSYFSLQAKDCYLLWLWKRRFHGRANILFFN